MKNKKYHIFIVILATVLLFSIRDNIKQIQHKKYMQETILNHLYFNLKEISTDLASINDEVSLESTLNDTQERMLNSITSDFVKLDTTLNYYLLNFANSHDYAGIIDFEFISTTLSSGIGEFNNITYHGILVDNKISANEYEYLKNLKNDIDIMIVSLTSDDNPLQENKDLSSNQVHNIVNLFFDRFSWGGEDSPFILISE